MDGSVNWPSVTVELTAERFDKVVALAQAALWEKVAQEQDEEDIQALSSRRVLETVAIHVAWPLLLSIASNASYDVLKSRYQDWQRMPPAEARKHIVQDSPRIVIGPPRGGDPSIDSLLGPYGFTPEEIRQLQDQIANDLQADVALPARPCRGADATSKEPENQ